MKVHVIGTWQGDYWAQRRRARQAEVDALYVAIVAAVEQGSGFRSAKHFAERGLKHTMWITRAFRDQYERAPRELFIQLRLVRMRRLHAEGLGSAAIARRVGMRAADVRAALGIEIPRRAA